MHPLRSGSLARIATLVVTLVIVPVSFAVGSGGVDAAPTHDRAHHGYDSVGTNGFGATESWAGNLRLFTGHDQSGEAIIAYCIQRGLNYPRGTDPQFADANSGFGEIGDVPVQRGVPAADRQALAYAVWRYGATTDDRTAAAMFLLTHLLSGDPDFGSTTLDATVLGPDWPQPDAVMARARAILAEARARRGPWTVDVAVAPVEDRSDGRAAATATVVGPGGPVAGVDVRIEVQGRGEATVVTTGDDGRARHAFDVPGLPSPHSGDAERATDAADVTGTSASPAGVEVDVTATVAVTPGLYRIFHGRPGTQQVITGGGDGAPVSATAAAVVPVGSARVDKTTTNPAYQSGHGATYEIRRADGDGPVVAEVAAGPDGRTPVVDHLVAGDYVAVEVAAPSGQLIDPDPVSFTVRAGDTTVVDHTNDVARRGRIAIVKVDGDDGRALAGAVFLVAADADGDGTFEQPIGDGPDGVAGTDDDGRWVTTDDADEPTLIDGLAAGAYEVTEVRAPDGYALAAEDERSRVVELTYGDPSTVDDDVEHVEVRLANDRVPPPTTAPPTTTTEPPPPTTAAPPVTTPTTVAARTPIVPATAPPPHPPARLADTGLGAREVTVVGLAVLLVGVGMVVVSSSMQRRLSYRPAHLAHAPRSVSDTLRGGRPRST